MFLSVLSAPLLFLSLPLSQDDHAGEHPLDEHPLDEHTLEEHPLAGHAHDLHAEPESPVQVGLVLDTEVRWIDADESDEDGLELNLRTLELGANGWLTPDAWLYGSLAVHDGEVELEEAALHYHGLGDDSALRAGRFYLDFGRQMQRHVDELPYPDRPLVLRTYLGDEVAGNGLELAHTVRPSASSELRLSLSAFDSLAPDEDHGHGHEGEDEPEVSAPDRGDLDELSYGLRLTHLVETSDHAAFQWGLSARRVGAFGLGDEDADLAVEDLANTIYGADVGYGWREGAHGAGWSIGAEWLLASGDLAGEVVDDGGGPELEIFDDEVQGHYLWIERLFDHDRAAGILWSVVEPLEDGADDARELVLYHTRHPAENLRLRFAVSHLEHADGDDELALVVQLTSFLGPHSHGTHGHASPSRYDLDR